MKTTDMTWSHHCVEPRPGQLFVATEAGVSPHPTRVRATGVTTGVTVFDNTGLRRLAVAAALPAQVTAGIDERTTPGVPLPAG